ncbi:hypothetical protein [Atlantibacter hermannii]|uniref:hypothetical protein n=1 Tax=Atlantibacter hermannii TaxID=565 RepID=UPI0028A8CE34|nr:hypothetical protein [Atlantibacter hermannii]
MTTKSKQLVCAGHDLASELKADCGAVDMRSVANLLTELASALDVQIARSDALAAEQARYSMPAGEADQRMAESRAVRQALGFGQDADDVAPVDLVERINALAEALKSSEANDADARCHVAELEEKCAALAAELKQSKIDAECCKHGMEQSNKRLTEIAAESAVKQEFIKTCFQAAAEGCSLDGADVQELGERLGLFGRETYQPALHGYICGHEAGEDSVYVMKKSPATDEWVNEQRAVGVDGAINVILTMMDRIAPAHHAISMLRAHAAQLRGSQV